MLQPGIAPEPVKSVAGSINETLNGLQMTGTSSAKRIALGALLAWVVSPAAADVAGIPRIVGGDTVEIERVKIRLEGIDAPETDQLCLNSRGQRWTCGIEARDQLSKYVGGRPWICRISGQDRYGRSLARCQVDGQDVGEWMVRSGWALSFTRYSHSYDLDERVAREARQGLWAGAFIAPWDWRSRNKSTVILGAYSVPIDAQKLLLSAASAAEAPSPDCVIKGNVNRGGECIYHSPGGQFYSRIDMDLSKGKRWFCTEEEAQAAGCRKSMR
jgi:endonuclease YncB( thermonuclease family)